MKIKEIPVPEKHVDRMVHAARCSRIVKSTGTHYFNNNKNRCGRLARFNVDGIAFCTQHAGEAALFHLIKTQDNQE